MNKQYFKKGFTVIEVILVITTVAVLAAAMMRTVQVSINRQRYNDAVKSLRDFLQSQYKEVNNIAVNKVKEPEKAELDQNDCKGIQYGDGRSDCLLVGRLLTFAVNSNSQHVDKIIVKRIYYKEPRIGNSNFEDFIEGYAKKEDYNVDVMGDLKQAKKESEYLIEWSSWLNKTSNKKEEDKNFTGSVLILRSPEDGSVRTYYSKNIDDGLSDIIKNSNENADICVISDDPAYGAYRAIRINKGSNSEAGVEILPTDKEINGIKPVLCVK